MTGSDLTVRSTGQAPAAAGPISESEFNTLFRTARALAASGLFKDSRQAEQAFARILLGRDLGLSPTESLTSIYLVEGRPELSADLQAAMLRTYVGPDNERYDYRVVTPVDKRADECHITVYRRRAGDSDWEELGTEIYTLKDANQAGLTEKKNWRLFRKNMLFARAISNAIAFHAPETAHSPRTTQAVIAEAAAETSPGATTVGTPAAGGPDANVSSGAADQASDAPGEESSAAGHPEAAEPETIDGTATEEPSDDAARRRQARIDAKPRPSTKAQYQHLVRIFQEQTVDARFLEALDIVGAPEHEEIAQRVVGMTEGMADEVMEMFRKEPLHA